MRIESENKKTDQITYKDYKKKNEKNQKQTILMFISIFMVLLLVFLGFAKIMSPDVDIAIGDESTQTQYEEEDDSYQGGVDHRLKKLQEEDDGVGLASEEVVAEDAGVVKIPKKEENQAEEQPEEKVEDSITLEKPTQTSSTQAPTPAAAIPSSTQTAASETTVQNTVTYRVVVGMYNTPAQADVARGILQDAGLGVTPHVRQMGNGYTLQVGAYSSKDSANNLSNKLLMNNYPARVVIE